MSEWDLNEADINLLMDAIGIWAREEMATDVLSELLVHTIVGEKGDAEQTEVKHQAKRDAMKTKARERQEMAVLVQAKLVRLKRQLAEAHVRRMLMS